MWNNKTWTWIAGPVRGRKDMFWMIPKWLAESMAALLKQVCTGTSISTSVSTNVSVTS
jgi:hypothetical protein